MYTSHISDVLLFCCCLVSEFEQLAVKVLDECHYTQPDYASGLLEQKCPLWNNLSCLELAAQAQDKVFLSSVACQNVLDRAWKKGLVSAWPRLLLCILCPPLICCLLDFEDDHIDSCMKVIQFYRAPVVKFVTNMVRVASPSSNSS